MQLAAEHSPLIKQGWIRALLLLLFYIGLSISGVYLLGLQTHNAQTKNEFGNEGGEIKFMRLWVIISFVAAVISVIIFRNYVDRKPIKSLGLNFSLHHPDSIVGFFTGLLILCVGMLILTFHHDLKWMDINLNGSALFINLGLMAILAVSEELVFRGYVLNNLMDSFGKWVALGISAALFAIVHANNPSIQPIAIANLFLGGLLLGINYIYTRNLGFAILLHFSWNFFQGPVFGLPVSGVMFESVFQNELAGNPLLTGGNFGFEASALCTALLLVSVLIMYFLYEQKNNSPVRK